MPYAADYALRYIFAAGYCCRAAADADIYAAITRFFYAFDAAMLMLRQPWLMLPPDDDMIFAATLLLMLPPPPVHTTSHDHQFTTVAFFIRYAYAMLITPLLMLQPRLRYCCR